MLKFTINHAHKMYRCSVEWTAGLGLSGICAEQRNLKS